MATFAYMPVPRTYVTLAAPSPAASPNPSPTPMQRQGGQRPAQVTLSAPSPAVSPNPSPTPIQRQSGQRPAQVTLSAPSPAVSPNPSPTPIQRQSGQRPAQVGTFPQFAAQFPQAPVPRANKTVSFAPVTQQVTMTPAMSQQQFSTVNPSSSPQLHSRCQSGTGLSAVTTAASSGLSVMTSAASGGLSVQTSAGGGSVQHASKDAFSFRPVATPVRSEEHTWSTDCCWRLCSEGQEKQLAGKAVPFLDKHLASSLQDAVAKLNRHLVQCYEEFCAVFAPAEKAYYMLYRRGCREKAMAAVAQAVQPQKGYTKSFMPKPSEPIPAPRQHKAKSFQPFTDGARLTVPGSEFARFPTPKLVSGQAAATNANLSRATTPRECLERDLTEIEKVKYSDLKFKQLLGSGEFGQVFLGIFKQQEVAIKRLYWDNAMGESVMLDLAKEIESFRHLRHTHLVCFIGACLEMPHPCIITEYMPGGSLHTLLHVKRVSLPPCQAVRMCMQLADAVRYLHAQNPIVVHRDLKSLNVVMDLHYNVKICDFGLTEQMRRTHITKKNNGGSPRYMAPELFDSKAKVTEKIDVWAMGCIFVEVCGGPLPYSQITTLVELTKEILVRRRTPDVPREIHSALRDVCLRCTTFESSQRVSSSEAFNLLKAAKSSMEATRNSY